MCVWVVVVPQAVDFARGSTYPCIVALARARRAAVAAPLLSLMACGGTQATVPLRIGAEPGVLALDGFAPCRDEQPGSIVISKDAPLVVIVHGCLSSGGAFRSLAEVFQFHGQQAVCFNYNDRDSLRAVALRFRRGIDALQRRLGSPEIVVLGHSQGGLIARLALSDRELPSPDPRARFRLVTVSSPFSGIRAARHCGLTWLHIVSLGITTGICQAITGSNWMEIPPSSVLWTKPRPLERTVHQHIKIVTDEKGTCRRQRNMTCEEDDFVFSLREQSNRRLLVDSRVQELRVKAGHVEIVGERGVQPRKLIRILQSEQVLRETPRARRGAFEEVMARVFGDAGD